MQPRTLWRAHLPARQNMEVTCSDFKASKNWQFEGFASLKQLGSGYLHASSCRETLCCSEFVLGKSIEECESTQLIWKCQEGSKFTLATVKFDIAMISMRNAVLATLCKSHVSANPENAIYAQPCPTNQQKSWNFMEFRSIVVGWVNCVCNCWIESNGRKMSCTGDFQWFPLSSWRNPGLRSRRMIYITCQYMS